MEAAGEETRPFGIIKNELARLRKETALSVSVAKGRGRAPTLARFSFCTRDLAGAAGAQR